MQKNGKKEKRGNKKKTGEKKRERDSKRCCWFRKGKQRERGRKGEEIENKGNWYVG